MYNPSNHIPLSKSMGPNAFPVDGKYMYFTNGENSVYRYRPFQSTAEAIDYFPLGSSFRGSPEGQPWAFEILINEGGALSVDGGYITGGVNSVWWWRDGVLDTDLIKKNGPTTSDIKQYPFTRADLTNVADGMGDLVLPFTGGQIALGLISRAEITEDGIPKGALVANLAGGPVTGYYGQVPDVDQYGIVYYVGEAVPFEATMLIDNNSSQNVDYHLGAGVGTLLPGESDGFPAVVGSFISVDVLTGQTCVYTVYDSIGGVVFTFTQIGTGTLNGLPMTDDQSQEFIISNT